MPRTSKSSKKAKSKRPPWRKAAPKSSRHSKLTKGQRAKAKAEAKRAGRPYPNLVDNMQAASSTKRSRARKTASRRKRRS